MSDEQPQIDPSTARELAEAGDAIIIDVRDASAHDEAHIAGATSIPIDELEARLGELPDGTRVLTACGGGTRGPRAAALLREHGVDATAIQGGLRGWRGAGLPVEEV
jgi:rhodanese-related sulfurtransferase